MNVQLPTARGAANLSLALDSAALDRLMPMHLVVSSDGDVVSAGPTLRKLRPTGLVGAALFDIFHARRPQGATSLQALAEFNSGQIQLSFADAPYTNFRAVLAELPDHQGALINLSFGIAVVDAVETHDLTIGDFAATDLTVEMLYLVEAKSAAMEESKKLNQRLQGAKAEAEQQAATDMLTGLKNRRAADEALLQMISSRIPFALMHIDLDLFKQVNDTLGHAAGDAVLQAVSKVLMAQTRSGDVVARVGGDEFLVMFPAQTDCAILEKIGNRIIENIEVPIPFQDQDCRISASIGITKSDLYDYLDADQMLNDADTALYGSKHAGRGCVTLFRPDAPEAGEMV